MSRPSERLARAAAEWVLAQGRAVQSREVAVGLGVGEATARNRLGAALRLGLIKRIATGKASALRHWYGSDEALAPLRVEREAVRRARSPSRRPGYVSPAVEAWLRASPCLRVIPAKGAPPLEGLGPRSVFDLGVSL